MQLKIKKIVITTALIGCLIFPSLIVTGQEDRIFESLGDFLLAENPLVNVTIEMLTNLSTHRSDGIPSTLPDSSFTVQFNITNLDSQELNQLEIAPTTNAYGTILNPLNETKDTLSVNESWITQEYLIETTAQTGVTSNSLDLAIVLDQSGSMGDEIDVLTAELVDVIDEISDQVPDLRVSLILFGGGSSNPYLDSSLIYPLTTDIESIADVLGNTVAGGGHEPWGDALWVAKNRLDWRETVAKLIVLITDEPCDGGVVIGSGTTSDYDGPELYDFFEGLASEDYILCSIAASGSDSLTYSQLESGAEYTDGTFIKLGGDGPQTGDIPEIIGELIVYYSVELNLKFFVKLSHMNEMDVIESVDRTFVVLLDDLPPEIDSWVYMGEDFITDEKFINIMCEVKDVSGIAYVDIYYKPLGLGYWIIANASQVFNFSYVVTIPYDESYTYLSYRVYAEDCLCNEILSDIAMVNVENISNNDQIETGKRKEFILLPNQSVVCKLLSDATSDSFGLIFSKHSDEFETLVADVTDSAIILNNVNVTFQTVIIEKGHLVKVSLISKVNARVIVANVISEDLGFEQNTNRELDETDALLFKIDNKFNDVDDRSFVADSQLVQTSIIVFNATNWEHIMSGSSEVILPEEELYILVFADYHTGEIFISFDNEDDYTPYDHYWPETAAMPQNFWFFLIPLIGISGIIVIKKRRR